MKMTRNTVLIVTTIALALLISGCGYYGSPTGEDVREENEKLIEEADQMPVVPDSVGEDPIKSDIHTQEEYQEAAWAALDYFDNFKGCYMSEIKYAGDDETKAEAEAQGLDPKDIIVLDSTFETDERGGDGSLEPNTTYEHYKWIIVRDNSGNWVHKDHGYA